MGTVFYAKVAASDRAAGLGAIERALDAVRHLDDVLSTWRDDSEIARLNHAAVGRPVSLSDTLYELLREARAWTVATDGAFDPGVGALVDVWHLRGAPGPMPPAPAPAALAQARQATGLVRFRFDDATHTVTRLDPRAWLDTGGFGKGAALRAAARALTEAGITAALLNFGGQVLAFGTAPDGGPWPVPVAHPARRDRAVAQLRLIDRSASTSSQSERPNHILDPRTGRPVPAWGSVTVVARDPLTADALSTALFVLGPDRGLTWACGRPDIGVLFLVNRRGRLERRWNRTLEASLITNPSQAKEAAC